MSQTLTLILSMPPKAAAKGKAAGKAKPAKSKKRSIFEVTPLADAANAGAGGPRLAVVAAGDCALGQDSGGG